MLFFSNIDPIDFPKHECEMYISSVDSHARNRFYLNSDLSNRGSS